MRTAAYNPHAPDWHKVAPKDIDLTAYAKAWIDMEPHVEQLTEFATAAHHPRRHVDGSQYCSTIVEFGIRGAVSTWALLEGLCSNGRLYGVDIDPNAPIPHRVREDPRFHFIVGDSLTVRLPKRADLVMIDASHEFAPTVAELMRAATLEPEVILCHDYLYEHTPQVRWAIDGYTAKGYLRDEPYYLATVYPSRWGLAVLRRRESR